MKLIVTSSTELATLTGSFYANTKFDKIKNDVKFESEEIIRLVGKSVYDRAANIYTSSADGIDSGTIADGATDLNKELLLALQLPIAIGAAYRFMQTNLVSHDESSRKVKLDKQNETMAWQWMIDADNEAHLKKRQEAIDNLIRFLDDNVNSITEWKGSDFKKATKELFIPNTATFQDYFPIDQSAMFYHSVRPFIAQIQKTKIKQALQDDYESLLASFQSDDVPDEKLDLLIATQEALALLTMATAFKRMSIQYLPMGVVQRFASERNSTTGSKIPSTEDFRKFSLLLERDAEYSLDQIRQLRYANDPDANKQTIIPKNEPRKKYART